MVRKGAEFLRYLSLLTQVGLTMVFSAGFGVWLGRLLDARLGTRFVFTCVLLFLGIAGGMTAIFRIFEELDDDAGAPKPK